MILLVPNEKALVCASQPTNPPNAPANRAGNLCRDLVRHVQPIDRGGVGSRFPPPSIPPCAPLRMGEFRRDTGDSSCCFHDECQIATSNKAFIIPHQGILSYLSTLIGRREPKVHSLHDVVGTADPSGAHQQFMFARRDGSYVSWHCTDDAAAVDLMYRYQPCVEREEVKDLPVHLLDPDRPNEQRCFPQQYPMRQGWSYHHLSEPKGPRIPLSDNHRPWYMPFPRRPRRYSPHMRLPSEAVIDVSP